MRHLPLLLAALLSLHASAIQSEVQNVTLQWTPMICLDSCVRGLEQQFKRIDGVTHININGAAGKAELKWDAKTPFSFRRIEAAVAMIGLGIDDMGITVRGNISHDGNNVILTSIGDNTRFFLLGTPQILANRHIEENSPFNRPLSQQMKAQLLDAEQNRKIVTLSGLLFQPETSPPLFLVMQSINSISN